MNIFLDFFFLFIKGMGFSIFFPVALTSIYVLMFLYLVVGQLSNDNCC